MKVMKSNPSYLLKSFLLYRRLYLAITKAIEPIQDHNKIETEIRKKKNFECPSGTPNCSTKSVEIITMMTKTRDSENKNMAVDGKRCQFSVLKS